MAGVVVVLAGGGVAAWAALGHHGRASASPRHPASAVVSHPPSTPVQPVTSPATSAPAPTPTASTGLVTVAPGVTQQGAEPAVVAFLNTYFTAINTHDYQQYRSLLSPRLQQAETEAEFRAGYRGTSDSAATLAGLAPQGPGIVAASITFTSHQPASDSPTHSGCTNWDITLYLEAQGNSYVIGSPPASYHASFQAC